MGDIKGCFDNLDHKCIIEVLRRKVHDETFRVLIEGMLNVGYVEDWKYYKTYSGTPQGGIVSPLLANIVLNEFDKYIEDTIIPENTKGKHRKRNAEYMKMANEAVKARKEGNYKQATELQKVYSKLPTQNYEDPNFRRLKYVRYADDFLLGFIGPREEARAIKEEIGEYLRKEVKLEMSVEKTLISHAWKGSARFLNYEIRVSRSQKHKQTSVRGKRTTRRTLVGQIELKVPKDVAKTWKSRVTQRGCVIHRKELTNNSDFDIIRLYESEVQGLINYYVLAQNVSREMWGIRRCYKESLLKTLANKHKQGVAKIAKKYLIYTADGTKVIGVEITREGKKPLRAVYGTKPIRRTRTVEIQDELQTEHIDHTQLIDRMLANECELCGKCGAVEGHHIKKLKDLKKKRRKLENWEKRMIAIRRKTLFVCEECHRNIHNGSYDGQKLA
jgi:hypothetical protein